MVLRVNLQVDVSGGCERLNTGSHVGSDHAHQVPNHQYCTTTLVYGHSHTPTAGATVMAHDRAQACTSIPNQRKEK
jgi:hypothetical protein